MKKLIRAGVVVITLSLTLLLFSCGGDDGGGAACTDADGDGYYLNCEPYDCDDSNDTVYPSAPELCDGLDNDCSGAPMDTEVDNDDDTYMVCEGDCDDSDPCNWLSCASCTDGDGDGYRGTGCDVSEDCDDSDDAVYPSAVELCDLIDNQCPGDAGYGFIDERCPAVQVSAGGWHTCALLETGGVKCWGMNYYGQLGDGTYTDTNLPVDVLGLSGVIDIFSGTFHTCALTSAGGVKCWGRNEYGELGDGTNNNSNVPVDVSGLTSGVIDIDLGATHTCALLDTGGVKCWGRNSRGQLGDGTYTDTNVPVDVSGLTSGVIDIAAGGDWEFNVDGHTCALLENGEIKCWGRNNYGQLGNGTYTDTNVPVDVVSYGGMGATKIIAGEYHTCAFLDTLGVKCWGRNSTGQLGDGTYTKTNLPVDVVGLPIGVLDIDAADDYNCALLSGGGAKCWGCYWGAVPADVSGLSSSELSDISAGYAHTCAIILSTGGVKCWGTSLYGQLGDGTSASASWSNVPVDVFGLSPGGSNISAGALHTCALLTSGGVKCWGANVYGQLGNGATGGYATVPGYYVYGLLYGVLDIATGALHTCALLNTGGIKCWGMNWSGQLGDGTNNNSNVPVDVSGLASGVLDIATGGEHTCALLNTGGVKCWGMNVIGQLGDGTNNNSNVPVDVFGLAYGVLDIAAGDYHTCALLSTGGVKCWGYNWYGQLGYGVTGGYATVPGYVYGLFSSVLDIATGGEHTCALLDTGGVKCWGANVYGQLGDGTNDNSNVPVDVSGLTSGVLDISAGSEHTCALLDTGGVKCWGMNWSGQLGNGTYNSTNLPVDVSGISYVVDISAGGEHTCAFLDAGGMKCWGANVYGQLGDGTNNESNVPVNVFGYGF